MEWRNNINFNDIEIINNKKGKPLLKVSNKLKYFLKLKCNIQKFKVFLSLSDEKDYAVAFVTISV